MVGTYRYGKYDVSGILVSEVFWARADQYNKKQWWIYSRDGILRSHRDEVKKEFELDMENCNSKEFTETIIVDNYLIDIQKN